MGIGFSLDQSMRRSANEHLDDLDIARDFWKLQDNFLLNTMGTDDLSYLQDSGGQLAFTPDSDEPLALWRVTAATTVGNATQLSIQNVLTDKFIVPDPGTGVPVLSDAAAPGILVVYVPSTFGAFYWQMRVGTEAVFINDSMMLELGTPEPAPVTPRVQQEGANMRNVFGLLPEELVTTRTMQDFALTDDVSREVVRAGCCLPTYKAYAGAVACDAASIDCDSAMETYCSDISESVTLPECQCVHVAGVPSADYGKHVAVCSHPDKCQSLLTNPSASRDVSYFDTDVWIPSTTICPGATSTATTNGTDTGTATGITTSGTDTGTNAGTGTATGTVTPPLLDKPWVEEYWWVLLIIGLIVVVGGGVGLGFALKGRSKKPAKKPTGPSSSG